MRLRRLFLGRNLVFVLGLASCKANPTATTQSTVSPDAAPTQPLPNSALVTAQAFLATTALGTSVQPARLYSWTTKEQAEEIRQTKQLLMRSESPVHGASAFDGAMSSSSKTGDPLATLLGARGFRKKRFAWTSAWATRMGWPDENYGDVLLSITLRPESYVARRDADSATWSVTTTEGAAARVEDVVAHPERLAAVIFERQGPPSYREVVVCNESRVQTLSFGTPTELDRLDDEIRGIEAVAAAVEAGDGPAVEDKYRASVAFRNAFYELRADRLRNIAAALRSVRDLQPAAGVFEGSAPFEGVDRMPSKRHIRRPPLRNGTYQ